MTEMITVQPLSAIDRVAWQELFAAYNTFYERELQPETAQTAWDEFQSGRRMHARAAWRDDRLVGIVHFFTHPNTTGPDVCYLQDLFTAADVRGRGVAGALIAAVADWAREQGCGRVYWHTHETNVTARRLYDRVAVNKGFLQYQLPLEP